MDHDDHATLKRAMPWLWAGAFLVTAIFGYLITPWEAISQLLENSGKVDNEGAQLIAFAAGYTLPATVGFAVLTWLGIHDKYEDFGPAGSCVVIGLTLLGTALICQELALGLLPDWNSGMTDAPGILKFPVYILTAYLNEYGWGLMLTAAAIGAVLAFQVEAWRRPSPRQDAEAA
ncbi:hypothetical protein [Aeromicrobium sp.]|uniref:hypothetical protein n=1 Tax=Aeromicrobium sp. TaxID=1871063 RepID=UPI0030BCA33A